MQSIYNRRILELSGDRDSLQQLELVSKALGSENRLAILHLLGTHAGTVIEIADALEMPLSTITQHITVLENAGLINTLLRPATRGLEKVCTRSFDVINIQLSDGFSPENEMVEVSMPIGAFTNILTVPTCGLASEQGIIGQLDDASAFFEPDRIHAQLIWFKRGFVEYRFPNRLPPSVELCDIEISFEVCSEAPLHSDNWPSEITVWVNEVEIGTWISPADFGGDKGWLTPAWWDIHNTQYGLLKVWKITPNGTFVDGLKVSNVSLHEFTFSSSKPLSLRIGIKEDASTVGGLNIFGKKFGNYPQDIVLRQHYHRK